MSNVSEIFAIIAQQIKENLENVAKKIKSVYDGGVFDQWSKTWDGIQANGTRTTYAYAFDRCVTGGFFDPKYAIKPTGDATAAFRFYGQNATQNPEDMVAILEKRGVTFDSSGATAIPYMFYYTNFSHLPVISTVSAKALTGLFGYSWELEKVDKLILKDDGSQTIPPGTFGQCKKLSEIEIEGVIRDTDFDIHDSPLNRKSILSIFDALSTTATGKTVSFSREAVNAAFTDEEWTTLIESKRNWTVALLPEEQK